MAPASSGALTVKPAPAPQPDLVGRSGARIERILVQRHVQHRRIGLEHVLRGVPVVDVVVDDRHAPDAGRPRVCGGHRHVVEQAEAHGAVALGVMARRPHERQRALILAAQHALDHLDARSRREQRDLVGIGRRIGSGSSATDVPVVSAIRRTCSALCTRASCSRVACRGATTSPRASATPAQ